MKYTLEQQLLDRDVAAPDCIECEGRVTPGSGHLCDGCALPICDACGTDPWGDGTRVCCHCVAERPSPEAPR